VANRSRTIGFGTGRGTEGVVVSPDIAKEQQNPELAAAEYLREIRDRYVLPGGMQTRTFNLAANVAQKFDESQTTYNAMLVTVTQGVALVYLGDFSGLTGTTGNIPHAVVSAAIAPASQVFPLPPGQYIFTVQADASGACTGCITPMAL
jgi:hypothetical protein